MNSTKSLIKRLLIYGGSMKRDRNARKHYTQAFYNSFDPAYNTQYYGVFLKGKAESQYVTVDPIRYKKVLGIPKEIEGNFRQITSERKETLFRPAKKLYHDYNINFVRDGFSRIKSNWHREIKPLILDTLSKIQGKEYSADFSEELFMTGIIDAEEAVERAWMKSSISRGMAEFRKNELWDSLYAQFFHQLVSQIEALQVKLLTKNGYEGDRFDRNVLYAFKGQKHERIKDLDGFTEYDKAYAIWNFIKHNTYSTYKNVNDNYPDLFKEGKEYRQGELACHHIKLSSELIESILEKTFSFLIGYCQLVFAEDPVEALWNYEEFFHKSVFWAIRGENDPFGLDDPFSLFD
jgi:hypothetical protein